MERDRRPPKSDIHLSVLGISCNTTQNKWQYYCLISDWNRYFGPSFEVLRSIRLCYACVLFCKKQTNSWWNPGGDLGRGSTTTARLSTFSVLQGHDGLHMCKDIVEMPFETTEWRCLVVLEWCLLISARSVGKSERGWSETTAEKDKGSNFSRFSFPPWSVWTTNLARLKTWKDGSLFPRMKPVMKYWWM